MIDNLFMMIGGLALFMYGVTLLRETLGKISGKRVVRILEKVSDNPVKGFHTERQGTDDGNPHGCRKPGQCTDNYSHEGAAHEQEEGLDFEYG